MEKRHNATSLINSSVHPEAVTLNQSYEHRHGVDNAGGETHDELSTGGGSSGRAGGRLVRPAPLSGRGRWAGRKRLPGCPPLVPTLVLWLVPTLVPPLVRCSSQRQCDGVHFVGRRWTPGADTLQPGVKQ